MRSCQKNTTPPEAEAAAPEGALSGPTPELFPVLRLSSDPTPMVRSRSIAAAFFSRAVRGRGNLGCACSCRRCCCCCGGGRGGCCCCCSSCCICALSDARIYGRSCATVCPLRCVVGVCNCVVIRFECPPVRGISIPRAESVLGALLPYLALFDRGPCL